VPKKPRIMVVTVKSSPAEKLVDLKDIVIIAIRKGHYANKCPEIKAKDSKGVFKVR
jgi:hypothetical protein